MENQMLENDSTNRQEERINWKPLGWIVLCLLIIIAFYNWKISVFAALGWTIMYAWLYRAAQRSLGNRY